MNYRTSKLSPFGILVEAKSKETSIEELDIENLRKLFRQEQLILIRGFNTFENADHFSNYCERWGNVSIWPFGKVLELIQQENPKDHIFDNSYVPLHWDGMYRPQVPEYQIFHCVKAPLARQGGGTTFSNTILVLENVSDELKELWGKVIGTYQREMEFYNSKVVSPIIAKHPFRNNFVIRYNEPHQSDRGDLVNIPNLSFSGIESKKLADFHDSLSRALYNPKNFYTHEWQKGDVVIADNFSLLHGREAFESNAPRHIQRVHVLSDPPYNNPGLESSVPTQK